MTDTYVVWHGHHQAEFPIEVLPESYESRLKTIETIKSLEETPQKIAWRKKLFKVVIGPLPAPVQDAVDKLSKAWAELNKAWDEYDKARDEYDQAWAEFGKAWAAWNKAWAEYDKAGAEYDKAWAEYDKARAAWDRARAECDKAGVEYRKARAECDKAGVEFDKAVKAHLPKILKLHSKECGCAWTPNNRNIFSYMPEEEND